MEKCSEQKVIEYKTKLTNEEVREVLDKHGWTKEQALEYLKAVGGKEQAEDLVNELYPK